MEEKKTRRSFGSWVKNVYVPHYLTPTIIIVLVTLFGLYLIRDFFVIKDADFVLVVASLDVFRQEDVQEVQEIIEEEVGDVNGDGEVVVHISIYSPSLYGDPNEPAAGDVEL